MGNSDSVIEKKYYGFRIYKILEDGPLHKAGLREFEDFIIPPQEFNHNEYEIREYLNKFLEKEINLKIYNLREKIFYFRKVTPSLNWRNSDKGCLGAIICYENFINAQFNLLRVVKVIENSLSDKIGFIPFKDYIIGVKPKNDKIISLNSSEGTAPVILFKNVLKSNLKKDVELYVYNSKNGPKIIKVNINLKNNEIFGCDIIYGEGHEFPSEEIEKNISNNNSDIPSEIDLCKSIAISNNLYYKRKENVFLENKNNIFKKENSQNSLNFSKSAGHSQEFNNYNSKTLSPISINKILQEVENDINKSVSPLSLSKLSNENESENIIFGNSKESEKNDEFKI